MKLWLADIVCAAGSLLMSKRLAKSIDVKLCFTEDGVLETADTSAHRKWICK
jgi:hypothetical protein